MEFENFIIECKKCERCKLRANATQVVPGAGNPKSEIMFIGEAPGKQEDIQGLPFVGTSGKFLNEMLASIGLNRDDVYIANVLKCRPPENRDPLPEEINACSDWLTEQLNYINPKIVVTLGRFGMARFFGNVKISQVHGKVKYVGDKTYIALYHPAVALYNGGMRQTLLKDFRVIKAVSEMYKNGELPKSKDKKNITKNQSEKKSSDEDAPVELF
ncbi:MAG: uracil-DNA glycosylase [bacterium]